MEMTTFAFLQKCASLAILLKDLILDVYGALLATDFSDFMALADYITSRAILAPHSEDRDSINN